MYNGKLKKLRVNSNLDPAQLRSKSRDLFSAAKDQYEAGIMEKYNFKYVADNYGAALQEAMRQKNIKKKG